jgi:hypothetical protein
MTYTVVYGDFPQTRNYFWSLKIHAKGCNDIHKDLRKYGYDKNSTWDFDTIRDVALDYWADHIRESLDFYESEEAAIQSYIEETKGAMCPCAKKAWRRNNE